MGRYASFPNKKTARTIIVVCGFLFSIFSFVYLYVLQRDVLEALHFSLAHGKTRFAPFASAAVLTFVLVLLRWGINNFLGLKHNVHALAYFPSFLILCALTDIGRNVYIPGHQTCWVWLLPVLILLFVGGGYWFRVFSRDKLNEGEDKTNLVVSNLAILLVMCLVTMFIGNTERAFHFELNVERQLRSQEYSMALEVGKHSLEANHTLTALRAYAMAHEGVMGDRLFQYPQYYQSAGLFLAANSEPGLRFTNDSVYSFLGAKPHYGENMIEYLRSLCYTGRGRYVALDYYLSGLLLDKQLDEFVKAIGDFYEQEDALPRYYREAITLYQVQCTDSVFSLKDSLLLRHFDDYKTCQKELGTSIGAANYMRRKFGDTYWWYFDYQN